jgi:glycosyltransferase involved in cell wall biosynthesis
MINNKFVLIVTMYNAEKYIEKCLESILSQTYKNYELIVIDDCSTDKTYDMVNIVHAKYDHGFIIHRNEKRGGGALINMIKGINLFSNDKEDIIIPIGGDDFLAYDGVLEYLNNAYQDSDVYFTYGNFIPLSGAYGPYCKPIPDTRTYRKSGAWLASGLKSFKNKLWYKIDDKDLRDKNGVYFEAGGDAAFMYALIELTGRKYCRFIEKVLIIYNDLSPINDMRVKRDLQINNAAYIRSRPEYPELKGAL